MALHTIVRAKLAILECIVKTRGAHRVRVKIAVFVTYYPMDTAAFVNPDTRVLIAKHLDVPLVRVSMTVRVLLRLQDLSVIALTDTMGTRVKLHHVLQLRAKMMEFVSLVEARTIVRVNLGFTEYIAKARGACLIRAKTMDRVMY